MTRYTITGGPSKWDLMLSLFDATIQRMVTFTLCEETTEWMHEPVPFDLFCLIYEVERAKGDIDHWLFKGRYNKKEGSVGLVSGAFSTRTRKGWLEIIE